MVSAVILELNVTKYGRMVKNMKRIVIISNFQSVSESHKSVLEKLFHSEFEIIPMSFEAHVFKAPIDADLLVISLYSIYIGIQEYVQKTTKVIVLSTTISEKQYAQIKQIPINNPVLLVNYSPEMTLETLALFRQLGLCDYDFIPCYPGKTNVPEVEYAVTPGEADQVPSFVKNVVDIGHRTLDVSTITEIAVELNREDLLSTPELVAHFKSLRKASNAVSVLLGRTTILEGRFFKLLDFIDEGILFTNNQGIIFAINKKANELLNLRDNCVGQNIMDLLPNEPIRAAVESQSGIDHKLIRIQDRNIAFKSSPVITADEVTSILMIFNRFEEKEESQHKLRIQILGKGHRAKYDFNHIIGESPIIEKTKAIASKMARSNASVLITGESGTGKELFAQAIHNASRRQDYQFVAINCASIPESLLESELFGYEEGAFSGARKGGKIGLFELAHNGTIFLDEIGEMPIHLQSRLLRVIQEREVMRIGGDAIISVDVRIIAATNQDLKQRMQAHQFRTDLYYRLNVLTLNIPPLRDRGQDILLIFERIKREIKADYQLSSPAAEFLLHYKWEGNVRALRNCVEYLSYLDEPVIESEDLKAYLEGDNISGSAVGLERELMMASGTQAVVEGQLSEPVLSKRDFVLNCLYESQLAYKPVGRRSLLEIAKQKQFYITEGEIRKILNELESAGLAVVGKGRGGTYLTNEGMSLCKA